VSRVNGSHHRLKHKDGCVTTVPIHKNDDIPKGLLRKIIREDLEFDMDKFLTEWRNYKKIAFIKHLLYRYEIEK